MTSLELVGYINNVRKEGEAELTHAHFLQKVPKVLNGGEGNFSFTYLNSQNKNQRVSIMRIPLTTLKIIMETASLKITGNETHVLFRSRKYFAKEIDKSIQLRLDVYQSKVCSICNFKNTVACSVSKENSLCLDSRADGKKIYWAEYHE